MRFIIPFAVALLVLSACGRPGLDERAKEACGDLGVKSAESTATGDVIECKPSEAPPTSSEALDLTNGNYIIRPVSDLRLSGTESLQDIADMLKARFGMTEPAEGNYSEVTEITEDGANVTITFTVDGMMDDSLKAEQHVVSIFLPAAVSAGVTGYATRHKCWRGDNQDAWTTEPCP